MCLLVLPLKLACRADLIEIFCSMFLRPNYRKEEKLNIRQLNLSIRPISRIYNIIPSKAGLHPLYQVAKLLPERFRLAVMLIYPP